MQSKTVLSNAGELLVDLTIDSKSPQEDFGQASLEANRNILPDIENVICNKDSCSVPIDAGSDSETECNTPIHHIHRLNECLTFWIRDAEDFMFQIQEWMRLRPSFDYPLFERNICNEEKKVARQKLI